MMGNPGPNQDRSTLTSDHRLRAKGKGKFATDDIKQLGRVAMNVRPVPGEVGACIQLHHCAVAIACSSDKSQRHGKAVDFDFLASIRRL